MIEFAREGSDFLCHARQWLPQPPEVLFPFYADCRHMNLVLPPWIRFEILDGRDRPLAPGVTYDYRLSLHRLPLQWRTRITEVNAPHYFADIQERGPYAHFKHEHTFEPHDGGTWTVDRVTYRPPGGLLAPLINTLWVQRDLRRLFEHRHQVMADLYTGGRDPLALLTPLEPAA